jgi:hypothetical protein
MVRLPVAHSRKEDDSPELVLKFVRGSNNQTRAVIAVYAYQNGDICFQLEDKESGAEMWMYWEDVLELCDELSHQAAFRLEELMIEKEKQQLLVDLEQAAQETEKKYGKGADKQNGSATRSERRKR